jgi:hypothetical protein
VTIERLERERRVSNAFRFMLDDLLSAFLG